MGRDESFEDLLLDCSRWQDTSTAVLYAEAQFATGTKANCTEVNNAADGTASEGASAELNVHEADSDDDFEIAAPAAVDARAVCRAGMRRSTRLRSARGVTMLPEQL